MIFTPHHSSSSANLYTVSSGERSLLVEAGARLKAIRRALDYRLSKVDGCLISHAHGDHSRGVKDLMGAGVDCYMTLETADELRPFGHRKHIIEPLKQFTIGGYWTVLPFPTEHDCPGSVGFLVSDGNEKLLFATDTFYIRFRFPKLNIIAVECNYSNDTMASDLNHARRIRLLTSHFSLEHVLDFLKANDLSVVKEIFLLHLSDDNSDAEMFKGAVMAATGKPVTICDK